VESGGKEVKNFVLMGAAGYVAPRHMKAIKSVGGDLVAAYDPHDSVGILDSYFPDCAFFTEFERLDRHIEKLRMKGIDIDYVSVASPNYLHDAHCRWALRIGADAICEKPLVNNVRNLFSLRDLENGNKVYTILQLRLHENAIRAAKLASEKTFSKVRVNYCTPRGKWYMHSWKGDVSKSGGLATNIGVHLFDLVSWLFGPHGGKGSVHVETSEPDVVSGRLTLSSADVEWRLSVRQDERPQRTFEINGEPIEFSEGFAGLHDKSYERILDGRGFGIIDAFHSIDICEAIRGNS